MKSITIGERDYVDAGGDLPEPASTLYFRRSKRKNADESEDHLITGVRVVIGGPEDVNGLHTQYHKDPADSRRGDDAPAEGFVRNLTICADELVVRGTLCLPETNVQIFARRLVFEDDDVGGTHGCINTSPLPFAERGAPELADGNDGPKAGDIDVFVHELRLPGTPSETRFDLRGGWGQDAGPGRDGEDGKDVNSVFGSIKCKFRYLFGHCDFHHTFSGPIATHADLELRSGGMGGAHSHVNYGSTLKPTSGTDAKKPGKPGAGGAGGKLTGIGIPTRSIVDTAGGAAGAPATTAYGGRAGWPTDSASYTIIVWDHAICGPIHFHSEKRIENHTDPGKDETAPPAGPDGEDGSVELLSDDAANAWLHPLLGQSVLRYVRDAYLMAPAHLDELVTLLEDYDDALRTPHSSRTIDVLSRVPGFVIESDRFVALQLEFAALLHRIGSGLDYFGNPAGWTPLFSLPVLLEMYEDEMERALRTLLLARRTQQCAGIASELGTIAGQAINSLQADVSTAVREIDNRTGNLKGLREESDSLSRKIQKFTVDVDARRTDLENKARNDGEMMAAIKLGVSTLSGVLQVIPYGQPALGMLASAGPGVLDAIIEGNDQGELAGDLAGPLASALGNISKAALDERAEAIVKTAQPLDKRDPELESAQQTAKRLTGAGGAIGPALSGIASAIQGLSVPDTEIEARLSKLEAGDEKFTDLVEELRRLNESKAEFAARLAQEHEALAAAYSRVNSNLAAAAAFERQQRDSLAVLDHDALLRVGAMEQTARDTLAKYLYYVAKSYEYAVLEPYAPDYQLDLILDKIDDLLKQDSGSDTPDAMDELMTTFRSELDKIRDHLVDGFALEYTQSLEMRISSDQSPRLMHLLNDTGAVVVNLRDFNKVPQRWERVTIADVDIDFEFDGAEQLPTEGTVAVSITPCGDGTLRASNQRGDDKLFATRHPGARSGGSGLADDTMVWAKTHHFGTGDDDVVRPSRQSVDLLNQLVGKHGASIESKIAAPAAWTDVRIEYEAFSKHRPRLTSLLLRLHLNYRGAHPDHVTVDVRMVGGHVVGVTCSPDDVNGRGNGAGEIYRIYPKGTDVSLSAPMMHGACSFQDWEVIDTVTMKSTRVEETLLHLPATAHDMRVYCHYRKAGTNGKVVECFGLEDIVTDYLGETPTPAQIEALRDAEEHAEFRKRVPDLLAQAQLDRKSQTRTPVLSEPDGEFIDLLPLDATPALLESATPTGRGEWHKIDHLGSVGWIEHPASARP